MKIPTDGNTHLTYCLNVHRGETWSECLEAIQTHAQDIRLKLGRQNPFGLGLRLSRDAAEALSVPETLDSFRALLAKQKMYVFTINGFPYGTFHDSRVKENVYKPDWRTDTRREYTILLANVLADLLPEGVSGSISTVPGSYAPWISSDADNQAMAENLAAVAEHLERLRDDRGVDIHLGLEPEPDCFLETTDQVIEFMNHDLLSGHRDVIGICLDTCHLALQYENLCDSIRRLRDAKVRLSKIQLSSALRCRACPESFERLREFADPVYLHQVKVRDADGSIHSYADLDALLASDPSEDSEVRIHCHVPLDFEGDNVLGTTAELLDKSLFKAAVAAGAEHFEIETYTFDVLPEAIRKKGIVESITREYNWVIQNVIKP